MDHNTVLEFWFGADSEQQSSADIAQSQSALWWGKDDAIDQQILQRFEPTLKALISGQEQSWLETAEGKLAAILVLDQFSRNMYRSTGASFTQDALALHWALQMIRNGEDKQLSLIQRVFLYMPLEHSEQLNIQKLCLEKFKQLEAEAPQSFIKQAKGYVSFAQAHLDIIEQFGRFPHRNTILNRPSTEEEIEFLQQPGSSF